MNNEKPTCEKCFYYDPLQRGPGDENDRLWDRYGANRGRCRRHAPTTTDGFPQVKADDWCGELMSNDGGFW